jgi:hypothetical protein
MNLLKKLLPTCLRPTESKLKNDFKKLLNERGNGVKQLILTDKTTKKLFISLFSLFPNYKRTPKF